MKSPFSICEKKPLSNIAKSVIIVAAYLVVEILSSVKVVPMGGKLWSVTGVLSHTLFPNNLLLAQFTKLSLLLVIPAVVIGSIRGGKKLLEAWGVCRGFGRGLIIGVVCCLPMAVCNLIAGSIEFEWEGMLLYAVFPGLYEELMYRGFIFGMLHRYCKWGGVWAAIVTAVAFMLIHLWQAESLFSCVMIFGVTALGSLLYSWIYTEWDYNLWVPITMHTLMNFIWILLPIDGANTAAGNMTANIGRTLTIILVIVVTVIHKKRQGRKCFDYKLI